MNDQQQVASLAGIPMDQVQAFINQYIGMSLSSNMIGLVISAVVFGLCAIWLYAAIRSPRSSGDAGAAILVVAIIAAIYFADAAWDRYKMTHYPLPWILQDLRSSK